MKEYSIFDKEFLNSSLYQEFKKINAGYGNLKIRAYAAREALPLEGVHIIISTVYQNSKIVFFDGYTDASGMIEKLELPAPLVKNDNLVVPLSISYEIRAEDVNNSINQLLSVNLYDGVCVVQNIHFIPESGVEQLSVRYPIVPNMITVHLGKPEEAVRNISVSFTDYISNVASSELYPTWPREALEANIYCIISFAMNRIYNEWYRSKGYNFDITSSSIYDQAFVENRSTYENINNIVEEIFNNYVVKNGQVQPYFTRYCDGRKTQCDGLSQWGSVSLANQGKKALDILKYYYGDDISIQYDAPVGDVLEGYPGYEVGFGSAGNPVLLIQRDLKRIRKNYPAIPNITNTLGIFDEETVRAVQKFQEIFSLPVTGIVNKATWYKIKYIYTSVKKLSDLYSEGLSEGETTFLYEDELNYGDTGIEVEHIHYFFGRNCFFRS